MRIPPLSGNLESVAERIAVIDKDRVVPGELWHEDEDYDYRWRFIGWLGMGSAMSQPSDQET